MNGVDFVYARSGDTYASLAAQYNLFISEILKFNDLKESRELIPGEMVYIQVKKSRTKKGLDMYIVSEDGEDLRSICQRFGVKMSSVMRRNGLSAGDTLAKEQEIRLR